VLFAVIFFGFAEYFGSGIQTEQGCKIQWGQGGPCIGLHMWNASIFDGGSYYFYTPVTLCCNFQNSIQAFNFFRFFITKILMASMANNFTTFSVCTGKIGGGGEVEGRGHICWEVMGVSIIINYYMRTKKTLRVVVDF